PRPWGQSRPPGSRLWLGYDIRRFRMAKKRTDELESVPKSPPRSARKPGAGKTRVTLFLREELWQEARTIVVRLGAGGIQPASLSQLFDNALERELVALRRRYNTGKPFPRHLGGLPGGRVPQRR